MPSRAAKLLERMRRSKAGWKRVDLDTLYLGFGFSITPGASHDIVEHPEYAELRQVLPRHRVVSSVYARKAVDMIDRLLKLSEESEAENHGDQ